jgi:hypothetical protein
MKKVLIILISSILLFGTCSCASKKVNKKNEEPNKIETVKKDNTKKEDKSYTDNNPIKIGLYLNINGTTTLVDHFDSTWKLYKDITVLSAFFTQDKTLPSNSIAGTFDTYKNKYTNIDNYRIGYHVKFTVTSGEVVEKTILNINDSIMPNEYLQFYLYDDLLHRNDNWYLHVTAEQWNTSTMLTSFKVTCSTYYYQITSPIAITVFTYDGKEDFDEKGNYRGISSYTALLNNI